MNANVSKNVIPQSTNATDLEKKIRGWVISLVIFGGLSIFANGTFDPTWGIVLLSVAILSWKNKIPAMFIIYSVIMGGAALFNIIGAIGEKMQAGWLMLALFQVVWAISLARQYRIYRHLPSKSEEEVLGKLGKASAILSIICLLLPIASCMGMFTYIILTDKNFMVAPSPASTQLMDTYFTYIFGIISLVILALGMGMAALTTKTNRKGWAISGIVMSAIMLAGYIGFAIIGFIGLLMENQGMLPMSG